MNSLSKNIIIIFLLNVVMSISESSIAQNYADGQSTYRVTAYQKGKNQVISTSNEIEITPPVVYYIPNAFTPNGDGLNDTFGLIGEGITEYTIQIFNRWGNLIFESQDTKNQWDGTYHNEKSEIGVYVYKISAKGPTTNGKYKKLIYLDGIVTLVM